MEIIKTSKHTYDTHTLHVTNVGAKICRSHEIRRKNNRTRDDDDDDEQISMRYGVRKSIESKHSFDVHTLLCMVINDTEALKH